MLTATAKATADYLVWLAAHECEDDPDFLTPLKQQKLLYFVQGWSYAEFNRPFFRERIEAWRNGPVVPDEYDRYKNREKLPILPTGDAPPESLTDADKAHIRSVWDAYKRFSAWALSDITHLEPAYAASYKAEDASGRCRRQIDPERIAQTFRNRGSDAIGRLGAKRQKLRAMAAANTLAATGSDVF